MPDREPPGAAAAPPSTMDKIAQATDVEYRAKPGGTKVKFNLQDADLAELVNHISGMTGKRFIYGAKVRQIKATVVSPEPVTLDEAYQAFLSILEVNGMTVVPHGQFLKIVDSAGVANQPTPVYSRGAPVPSADSYITRMYRLRYVNADEAAQLLTKFKSKEGDVSVYGPGQLLIITDTGTQVNRMIRILEEVDVGGAGQQMWIEPINYGAASDVAQRINDLFEVGQGTGGGLSKVIADEQTNSLVVVGNEEAYGKLLEILKKLDTRSGEVGAAHVLPLQHAVAEELAQTLQQMLTGQAAGGRGKGGGGQAAVGNAGGMFEGDVNVTPDKATNSLVVSSSARDFAQVRIIVDRLDQPRRQVFIEAVIMDVGVSDSQNLGFSWHGGANEDIGGGGDSLFLGGFNAANSVAFPTDPSVLQGFAAGVRGVPIPGTSNLFANGLSIPAFGVVLQALASSGRGNVLATPHVIATDNVVAEINVGENIPLQTNVGGGLGNLANLAGAGAQGAVNAGTLSAIGGFGFAAPREDVGNRIKVTPHINESDQVRLEIELESSAPGTPVGALGAIPITRRTTKTTAVVKDQQTIVIGGLMKDEYTTSKDKVPVLGDIPVLGFLFSSTKTTKRKSNLLLILTPHVIREQADLRRIFERKMRERQEFLDRYFVFATDEWKPPMDYTRANGLVEDIRQAHFEIDEQQRLEEELKPRELHEHTPSDAIELPATVKPGGGGGGGAPAPARPRRGPPQQAPQPAPAAAPRTGMNAEPLRIAPIARNVTVERVE
jgi:general secretion pathway protein D